MKTIAFIAAVATATLAVSAASTPAFAKAQSNFGATEVTYNQKTGNYCFKDSVTGSRIPVIECKTKDEWAQAGLIIRHKVTGQLAQR